jgi:proline dehydrogenase
MRIFENTEIAFRHRSNKDLKKAEKLFRFMEYPQLVKISGVFARFAVSVRLPLRILVKPVFRHFCAGESLEESADLVDFLAKFNVRSVLDFAAEKQESENEIRSVMAEITRTIDFAKNNPSVSFSVFKPSGLAPSEILDSAAIENPASKKFEREMEKFLNNIRILCRAAGERDIPVMIDAEESHYQDPVDKVAAEMMQLYNREKAIVFNTLQMYRHDRLEFLDKCIQDSREKNYHLGVKIVRGAYMDQERSRALKMGYGSPVYPDKESTDRAFNSAIDKCLENIGTTELFLGTHNEKSLLCLMDKMRDNNLGNDDPRIFVSQLYGMSDHISFNMAYHGYNVAKYIPYGPVNYLIPYLLRRAEENRSVTGDAGRERHYINLEIKRRMHKCNQNTR